MLTRRDVLRVGGLLGLGTALGACGLFDEDDSVGLGVGDDLSGTSVVVVGAGAAGMSAAYLLTRVGADVTVLEAAPQHGGRIKTADDFVDFPIPLGGEWNHVDQGILARIVDDDSVDIDITQVAYRSDDSAGSYDGDTLSLGDLGDYPDLKFKGHTWLTFFDEYVMPSIADVVKVNAPVASIAYGDDGVTVTEASGKAYDADVVVVTAPIQIIRDGDIDFDPPLPADKVDAFDEAFVWGGFKLFMEFSERFYPTLLEIEDSDSDDGQKLWYDAAYGQNTQANVLGLFTVGDQSEPYQAIDGDALRDFALAELDAIFDGAASPAYVQHIAQDWSAEPTVRQAYLADGADWRLPSRMRQPVASRLFFAGDAYTNGEDWSSVHMAAQSAREAVELMIDALS